MKTLLMTIVFNLLYSGYSTQNSDASASAGAGDFFPGFQNGMINVDDLMDFLSHSGEDTSGNHGDAFVETDDGEDASSSYARAVSSLKAKALKFAESLDGKVLPAGQLPDLIETLSGMTSEFLPPEGQSPDDSGELVFNNTTKALALASEMLVSSDIWNLLKSEFGDQLSPQSFANEMIETFGLDNDLTKNLTKAFEKAMESISDEPTVANFAITMAEAFNETLKSMGLDSSKVLNTYSISRIFADVAQSVTEKTSMLSPDLKFMDVTTAAKLATSIFAAPSEFYKFLSTPLSKEVGYLLASSYVDKIADSLNLNDYERGMLRSALRGTVSAMGYESNFMKYMDFFRDISKEMKTSFGAKDTRPTSSGEDDDDALASSVSQVIKSMKGGMKSTIRSISSNDLLSHWIAM